MRRLSLGHLYEYGHSGSTGEINLHPLIVGGIAKAAQAVFVEKEDTPKHAERVLWAQKAILNPVAMAHAMVWGVLADQKVVAALPEPLKEGEKRATPTISDDVIETAVAEQVNNFLHA